MKPMFHRAHGAVLVALLLCLSSCKDKEKPAPTPVKPAAEPAGPRPGGHLRIPSNEPRYLNPIIETRFERANMLIFEGLVGLDARLEPVPRLATGWERSPDGKTVTFKLRQNVKWHDGEPFTARDVAFTFQAIRDVQAPSLWKAYMASVDSLTTPDDYTVVVTYKRPYAPALTAWTVGILPKHIYGTGDLVSSAGNREPVGTGPYKLSRWEPGKLLLLQANSTWWYGRPYIDTIEILVDVPTAGMVDALAKGHLDFAGVESIEDWSNRLQSSEFREKFEVSDVVESRFRVIAWNVQRPILSDKRVRLALTHALNRGRVIEDVLFGQARPISAPFFPNMFGADPSIAPHPFDPAAAAKLLDEAGYPAKDEPRFSIELIALESQKNAITDGTVAIFRNDLQAIGVDLQLTYLPVQDYFARINVRDFDAAYFGWLPDIPDPDPFPLLHSSMIGAGTNYAGYANAEVDKLLEDAQATTDRGERKALYHKLHRLLQDELPYTVLYAPYGHYAWSRRLRGVVPQDIASQPRFPGLARWWIGSHTASMTEPQPKEL